MLVKSYEVDWAWGKALTFWFDEPAPEQLSRYSSIDGQCEVKKD
jgi:hypothetical protein